MEIENRKLLVQMPGRTWGDIWYNLKLSWASLRKFFYHIWWFRGYDSSYTKEILLLCLKEHLKAISSDSIGAMEIDETRIPKENKLKRAIELLTNKVNDDYAERCGYDYNYDFFNVPFEDESGEELYELKTTQTEEQKSNNTKALEDSYKLEDEEWKEFTTILYKEMDGWWT